MPDEQLTRDGWLQLSREDCMLRIWRAQGQHCPICGIEMLPVSRRHSTNFWTIEHVFPRRRYRCMTGNTLVSHNLCNNGKGDREPTGCELIILHVANARLGRKLSEQPLIEYRDAVSAPSSLALQLQRLQP